MNTMSTLVDKLVEDLSKELGNDFARRASVRQGQFQHASTLCGKKWSLRTSQQLTKGEPINLVSFDPNFHRAKVFCRYKGCSMTNNDPAALKLYGFGKRDLYLCPEHRDELTSKINEMCKKEGVILTPSYKSEDLSGYIQLIPLLEKIYLPVVKGRVLPEKILAQEAVLNVRNFLFITNAVLNPENTNFVLPPVFQILKKIIGMKKATESVLLLLRGVMKEILLFFGVVYNWVRLAASNPGTMIGAGLGGALGMIGGAVFAGPMGAAGFAAGGATCGGMIGSGIYAHLFYDRDRLHDFAFEGNALGDLNMRLTAAAA